MGLYLGLALMLVALHAWSVDLGPNAPKRAHRHALILQGEGKAPWAYRVLSPAVTEVAIQALSPVFERHIALPMAYMAWRLLWTSCLLLLFHGLLRTWLDPPGALAGTLLLAALQPASYLFYWYQPDSTPDLVLWTAAALLTLRGRGWWLVPLVLIGGLNRESAVFTVLIHLALGWGREPLRALLLRAITIAAVWATVFMGLRLGLGPHPWSGGFPGLLLANLSHPSWLAWATLSLGALWVLPWLSWRDQPQELRRLALALMLLYLPLQLVFGRIREVRLLLPLALFLVPMALIALRDPTSDSTPKPL